MGGVKTVCWTFQRFHFMELFRKFLSIFYVLKRPACFKFYSLIIYPQIENFEKKMLLLPTSLLWGALKPTKLRKGMFYCGDGGGGFGGVGWVGFFLCWHSVPLAVFFLSSILEKCE